MGTAIRWRGLAVSFFCQALLENREMSPVFLSGVLFTAFFLLADPVTLPLTRRGTLLFALGSAFLSAGFGGPAGFSIRIVSHVLAGIYLFYFGRHHDPGRADLVCL